MEDRERPEHEAVEEAEDGGRGADADRERHDGDEREAGVAAEQSERVPPVAACILEPRERPCVALAILRQLDAAEHAAGRGARLHRIEALALEITREHIEVRGHFARQLALFRAGPQEAEEPPPEAPQRAVHAGSSASSLSMRLDRRRQRSVSWPSAFTPARVIA